MLFAKPSMLFGDGSTGWHIVTGRYVLTNHGVPKTDIISASFPDKPWVAYQWLSDTLMAIMEKMGGLNMVAVGCSAAIAFLFVLIYDRARREGASLALSTVLVIFAVLTSAIHFLARPHIFVFWGVFLFATKLDDFYRSKITGKKMLAFLLPFMLVWVNTHPGFMLGLIMAGIYFIFSVLAFLKPERKSFAIEKAKYLAILLVVSAVFALLNPYGTDLFTYIFEYLKGSAVLAETNEFKSPSFPGNIHSICLEVLFVFLICGLARAGKILSGPALVTLIMFAHLALSAVRYMPLFAIVSVPFIALLFRRENTANTAVIADASKPETNDSEETASETASETVSEPEPITNPLAKLQKSFREFEIQENTCKMHVTCYLITLFLAFVACTGGSFMGSPLLASDFDKKDKPSDTLKYIKDNKLSPAHGFNYDNWGGILRYKLDERVYMDDRADFYGVPFYLEYGAIVRGFPGWQDKLKERKIEWVLMPNDSVLIENLSKLPDWKLATKDEAASLFVRK